MATSPQVQLTFTTPMAVFSSAWVSLSTAIETILDGSFCEPVFRIKGEDGETLVIPEAVLRHSVIEVHEHF